MSKIFLKQPTLEDERQVMNYKKVFLENNQSFDGCAGLEDVEEYSEWLDFDNRLSKKYGDSYVPSTVYLGIREADNKLVGMIDCRHDLSDFLLSYGGHIGYSVLVDERRKGYAKEMLRLVLDKYRENGKNKVLLTCDKANIASVKTIVANGGILENEVVDEFKLGKSGMIQRYWIEL